MIDPEREEMLAKARAEQDEVNWRKNVDKRLDGIENVQKWAVRSLIAGCVYFAKQIAEFVLGGGVIR